MFIPVSLLLYRSQSFASDAGILAKLNSINSTSTPEEVKITKKPITGFRFGNSKFHRRGSLNLLHKIKDEESCESSTENLGSTGSLSHHLSFYSRLKFVSSGTSCRKSKFLIVWSCIVYPWFLYWLFNLLINSWCYLITVYRPHRPPNLF